VPGSIAFPPTGLLARVQDSDLREAIVCDRVHCKATDRLTRYAAKMHAVRCTKEFVQPRSDASGGHGQAGRCTASAARATAPPPDDTFEMTFAKENTAEGGFNRWRINGAAYPMMQGMAPASFHLKEGKRYRLRMRNASDDIHPIHLHRHSFELTKLAGNSCAGVMKDVIMVGGYQEVEVDFTADNPGLTLFHCHQQLHMDFGFMVFDYV
jgi:FtsP/CotA-like multicopper oxidase with cupredoxin domain